MSDKITKSPQIRFAGFTDAWEQRKLGDVAERVRGNDGRMDLPTLTISAGSGWLDQQERFSGNIAGKEQKNYTLLSKGELSYNHGNSKLAKYGAVFVLRTYEEALVPRIYHSFKTTEESSPEFIEYMFATKIPDRELAKLISSGARMDGLLNINYDEFMSIRITIPKIEEQMKIAEILRKLDDTITLHQHKLELLKETKKSLLQKMFPKDGANVPEIRFAGFTDAWEQHALEKVAEFNPKSQLPNEFEYVDLESVSGTALVTHRTEKKETAPSRAQRLAQKGDVFYQTVRPYQRNNYLFDLPYNNYVFSTGYAQMRPNIDSYFLLNCIQEEKFVQHVLDRSTGTSYPAINSTDLAEINIQVPVNTDEQTKIGCLFKKLDQLITLHQRELNLLKNLKKSLLQQMFI